MRELYVVADESTDTLWVLRTIEGDRFCIPREDLTPPSLAEPATVQPHGEEREDDYEVVEAELVDDEGTGMETEENDAPSFTVVSSRPEPSGQAERGPHEPDPLFSTPLSLRPKDIQARIRAGASAEDLAEEMGVAVSRVEPYAHPVLLERTQVAEAAKQSHPVREDGPASDTLFEILALTFASRGHALSEATWDAVREAGEPWVVRVTWQAGLQTHQAEWFFRNAMGSGSTTEPRDPVAADLIDPSFAQPVRSLSPVAHGYVQDAADPEDAQWDGQGDDVAPFEQEVPDYNAQPASAQHPNSANEPGNPDNYRTQPNLFAEGELLQHPQEEDKPKKRRRKAVTPHWEDVLLGVRTNSKRPK